MQPSTDLRLALCALALLATPVAGVADGRLLYLERCAPCHGAAGRGQGPSAAVFALRPRDLHDGFLAKYRSEDLVRRIVDGRRLLLAVDVPAMRARATNVESLVAYLKRLPTVDWPAVDQGWATYIDRCAACHGPFGAPPAAPPPGVRPPRDLADAGFQAATSEAELVEAVRHGRRGMPALTPRLDERQAAQVAAFVRLLSPGFETYAQYCAACHGDHGVPSGSFGEADLQPTVAFDRAYFARHDAEALRASVWHMLDRHEPMMPHFAGVITDAEAAAIIEYLRGGR